MSKLKVAQVSVGLKTFDGLLVDIDANPILFGIGVPQIGELFPQTFQRNNEGFKTSNNTTSRNLKRIMGKGFKTSKHATELSGRNKTNVVYLPDFEKVILKLAFRGDTDAQKWAEDLIGLSLHQLCCDAFDQRFGKEERQEWLKNRQLAKDFFKELCEAVNWYWLTYERRQILPKFSYENAANAINRSLFGKQAKNIREELGLKKGVDLNRDHFGVESNRRIGIVQELAAKKVYKLKIKPVEAVKMAVADFGYEVISYKE